MSFLAWLLEDGANKGLGGPPNNWASADIPADPHWAGDTGVDHYPIAFHNDAGEIWIGSHYTEGDEVWLGSMNATTFRKMALWYLGRWAWGEWFGLRRRLFYMYLHYRVRKYAKWV